MEIVTGLVLLLQLQLSQEIINLYILPGIGGLMLGIAVWSLLLSPVGATKSYECNMLYHAVGASCTCQHAGAAPMPLHPGAKQCAEHHDRACSTASRRACLGAARQAGARRDGAAAQEQGAASEAEQAGAGGPAAGRAGCGRRCAPCAQTGPCCACCVCTHLLRWRRACPACCGWLGWLLSTST